ncbi:MAG: B12-binding domain-containing radical SAM protein [Candidatus Lokiarchaeota archaeon]|nr:B12-binding domain-containing radical SAM protein [Candidatus Lokiarchaeota archaeon]
MRAKPIITMILLINPRTSKPSEVRSQFFREPNLGLLYLAAILELNDIPTEILDLEQFIDFDEYELENVIRERIIDYKIFGITSLTNTFHFALNIARIIKNFDRNNYIILGGPHVSFMYEDILQDDKKTESLIDFICIGEAEISFINLVKLLTSQILNKKRVNYSERQLQAINGIAYINTKGDFCVNHAIDEIELRNIPLPARYKLSQENHYYTVANVIVNRGCPNQCSFCSRQNLFKNTRIRSVQSILEEIRDIQSLQTYNHINFYDNVNINKRFFRSFCRMFIENKITIHWGCELRVDTISPEDARLLKEAGCKLIATGIESANEKVLKTNFKYQDPEKVKSGIINLKKYNIAIQAYFVLGLPGESEQSFSQTIEFIKSLPLDENDNLNYFVATPYPGSRLWDEQEYFGIKIFENDFTKYDCNHIIFKTKELNKRKLEELYSKAKEIEMKHHRNI